jgi:hypothetical protein
MTSAYEKFLKIKEEKLKKTERTDPELALRRLRQLFLEELKEFEKKEGYFFVREVVDDSYSIDVYRHKLPLFRYSFSYEVQKRESSDNGFFTGPQAFIRVACMVPLDYPSMEGKFLTKESLMILPRSVENEKLRNSICKEIAERMAGYETSEAKKAF